MNRIQLTTNLYLDEYIPRELYLKYETKPHILIGLIDERLIKTDQLLRDTFGIMTLNNWWGLSNQEYNEGRVEGWIYNERGFRYDTITGGKLSQHRYGRASDKVFKSYSANTVRQYIIENYKEIGITCIEANVTWVHSDIRQLTNSGLIIV